MARTWVWMTWPTGRGEAFSCTHTQSLVLMFRGVVLCLRFLVKRSQGRRKVPKNFRRRYFVLTAKALTYAKSRSDAPLCEIPASDLLAVERVDDQAFNMKFVSRL